MIIRRGERPRTYTIVPNDVIEDEALTWEARGLLVYLLSKPDHWHVNREHLASVGPNGVRSVRTILTELEKARYLLRRRTRGDGGRIVWECLVYDQRQTIGAVATDGRSADGPATDAPPAGGDRAALVKTDLPSTESASTEKHPAAEPPERDPQLVRAEAIVRAHWDWCHEAVQPTPTLLAKGNPFVALRNIVRGLLDAGYEDAEIAASLRVTLAFTTNAITVALRHHRDRRGGRGGMSSAQQALAQHRARRITG